MSYFLLSFQKNKKLNLLEVIEKTVFGFVMKLTYRPKFEEFDFSEIKTTNC